MRMRRIHALYHNNVGARAAFHYHYVIKKFDTGSDMECEYKLNQYQSRIQVLGSKFLEKLVT